MKQSILYLFVWFAAVGSAFGQASWKPVAGKISTNWAEKVDPNAPLPEYPRPQMVRGNWQNLNGLWQYSILPANQETLPTNFEGNILVPFAIESSLSGVGRRVGKDSVLWYHQSVTVSPTSTKSVLLHFGAVDWRCVVYVNGTEVGSHEGGYDPFSFDITSALKKRGKQDLVVKVWDPSDDGPQPRGKQQKNPEGIWYTPVTGIWQTVWVETVPTTHISSTTQTPNIDDKLVKVRPVITKAQPDDKVVVSAWDGTSKVAEQTIAPGSEASIQINNPKLWSPDAPFLYDLKYSLVRKGKTIDTVKTYFAMRKISMAPDSSGIQRMLLNNKFLFHYGPLDQGWWPDGLYTAPTDEALKFDVLKTKEMGFNMIRKHVKVETARWYTYCDQLGILVWQDMPSGDMGNTWENRPGIYGRATDKKRTAESEAIYKKEWNEIMQDLYNFPSIVVWVPFNEAWGQFKTKEIVKWTMQKDPSRIVNTASGGNFENVGHIIDLHNYPEPLMPDPDLFGRDRILVLGEFGGLGLPVEGHTWLAKNNWGYQTFQNKEQLWQRYAELINRIPRLIAKGLSAAVYTQTTDVENETNGLMTYDRKIIKMPADKLKALHSKLYTWPVEHANLSAKENGNPVLKGWYADPEAAVFKKQFWVYPTFSAPYEQQVFMDAFSSSDLQTWQKHPRIVDTASVKWARKAMWAPAIIEKDSKYYLFFSANDVHEGEIGGIGVAVSDQPDGPFRDLLGKPLIGEIHNGAQPIDQFVFHDKDGTYYMIYGGWQHCNIVRLKSDFTGLDLIDGSTYKEMTPKGYVEGPFMFVHNNKYYFMWSEGGWTGPNYKVAYGISDKLTGPFQRIGTVLQQDSTIATGAGHHSLFHVPNKDEWYIVYHRRPLGETDANHRVVCIDKMEFDANGLIKPVKITFEGIDAVSLND